MLNSTQSQAERRRATFPLLPPGNILCGRRYLEYSPLKYAKSVRLLLLHPGEFCKLIACTIKEVDLESGSTYTALSYVWGDPALTVLALCNGCYVPITKNLNAALRRLRHRTDIVSCWVDALCINQSDIDERNSQVTLMGEIYSRALKVVIYLGEDGADSAIAFPLIDTLHRVSQNSELPREALYEQLRAIYFRGGDGGLPGHGSREWDIPGYGSGDWDEFQSFFRREWFSRIWVFQEAVLATADPWLFCGARKISWLRIASAVEVYHMSGLRGAMGTTDWSFHILLMQKSRSFRSQGESDLLQLLRHTRRFKSTDPRDRIFALFGLASETRSRTGPVELKADYRMALEDLYRLVARVMLTSSITIDFLSYTHPHLKSRIEGLPSWIPDWTALSSGEESHLDEINVLGTGTPEQGYCASAGLLLNAAITADLSTLLISGSFIDDVAWTSQIIDSSCIITVAEFRSPGVLRKLWENHVQPLGQSYAAGGTIVDAFWRTLIGNIQGDRSPATEKHYVHFLSYWRLSRLRDLDAGALLSAGKPRSSYGDAEARKAAAENERKSNFINADEVAASKRSLKAILATSPEKYCTCPRGPSRTSPQIESHSKACNYRAHVENPPWEVLLTVKWPQRTDDPSLAMMDDIFVADWFRRLRDDVSEPMPILQSAGNTYDSALKLCALYRRFFITSGKLVGCGPPNMLPGDRVALIAHAQMPFVLRRSPQSTDLEPAYNLIGEAYVHGAMHGSHVRFDNDGEAIQETIKII